MSDEEYMLHRQCMPIIRNAQPKDNPSDSILLHFCTPSGSFYSAYKDCLKLNFVKFDHIYMKKY